MHVFRCISSKKNKFTKVFKLFKTFYRPLQKFDFGLEVFFICNIFLVFYRLGTNAVEGLSTILSIFFLEAYFLKFKKVFLRPVSTYSDDSIWNSAAFLLPTVARWKPAFEGIQMLHDVIKKKRVEHHTFQNISQ